MSIFWVIFVIFLFFSLPPVENNFDDIFKEWKTDNRTNDRPNTPYCPHKICRETQEVHRFNLDNLGGYSSSAFLPADFVHEP